MKLKNYVKSGKIPKKYSMQTGKHETLIKLISRHFRSSIWKFEK